METIMKKSLLQISSFKSATQDIGLCGYVNWSLLCSLEDLISPSVSENRASSYNLISAFKTTGEKQEIILNAGRPAYMPSDQKCIAVL